MNIIHGRRAAIGASLVLLAALAACGDRVENTEMPQAPQANVEINRQGMEGAKDDHAAVGVDNQRGARTGYTGTLGAKGDTSVMDPDVLITERVKAALASNPGRIDVRSDDGDVTLKGHAPDPTARDRATEIARSIPSVRSVDNQITVG